MARLEWTDATPSGLPLEYHADVDFTDGGRLRLRLIQDSGGGTPRWSVAGQYQFGKRHSGGYIDTGWCEVPAGSSGPPLENAEDCVATRLQEIFAAASMLHRMLLYSE